MAIMVNGEGEAMTRDEIARLRALCEAATEGPWTDVDEWIAAQPVGRAGEDAEEGEEEAMKSITEEAMKSITVEQVMALGPCRSRAWVKRRFGARARLTARQIAKLTTVAAKDKRWLLIRMLSGRRLIVRWVCDCAMRVLPVWERWAAERNDLTDAQKRAPRVAIRTARAWARGKATIDQVRTASYAADAAAHAAAHAAVYTAHAAAYTAYAAAYTAYAADAYAYAAAAAAADAYAAYAAADTYAAYAADAAADAYAASARDREVPWQIRLAVEYLECRRG